ncbi:1,4-alpha-glucan branching protein GlgB [Candidatus Epulonipiscium viviparus]|uniref:1,4-alpha-glucan branching protein GlgB n=1 Tax=Candidatus Epulonipiscium viviparus TaxID=420336 RepID=UPI00273815B2|nr:1,4-alpha-glucan branching protein GlgB [Candidatus Epulopiscium viviparus]
MDFQRIIWGDESCPHWILGMHQCVMEDKERITMCVFCPDARELTVVNKVNEKEYMIPNVGNGMFYGPVGKYKNSFPYYLKFVGHNDSVWETEDAYAFADQLDGGTLDAFRNKEYIYSANILGSRVTEIDGIKGCIFRVFAPNAKRVSVIGYFNNWDGRRHMLTKLGDSGIFSIFIPRVTTNDLYQYEIKTNNNELLYKADPYAKHFGPKPKKHSLPYDPFSYQWNDEKYLKNLEGTNSKNRPISIYEVHIGSWKFNENGESLTYTQLADQLVSYVKNLNYTHVEFIGILEHPFDGSWGYQVTGFFAPTSRYGTTDEFKHLVDRFHQNDIGVILDWVPGHFPKDAFGLEFFDGTKLYEREGEHPDWGTLLFDYYKREVKNFLLSSAYTWLSEFHIDGLRVDAVASMLYGGNLSNTHPDMTAATFLQELNKMVHHLFPYKLMIAEDSSTWGGVTAPVSAGGLGFDFKWDLGFMHDTLNFMKTEYDYRHINLDKMTFSFNYMYNEHYMLPISHDEVVHCKSPLIYKMCGDFWQKFANVRALLALMFTHPGKKLLFMGSEIGQTREWIEKNQLTWELLEYPEHKGLQRYMKELNLLYKTTPALYHDENIGETFDWINGDNKESLVVSYIRRTLEEELIVVVNFSLYPRMGYSVGAAKPGTYKEIFNSDREEYCGSGVLNTNLIKTLPESCQYKENRIVIDIPPIGATILKKIK